MIMYLLTFYLFDNIEKNIGITHANHSDTQRQFCQILKNARASGTSIFSIFVFCQALSMLIVVKEKHRKQFINSSKTPFFGR